MSNTIAESKQVEEYRIDIVYDTCPDNPRIHCDHLGTMVCFHRRYTLGDDHNFTVEEFKEFVSGKNIISLPLYLYDHSGITMNTTGFSCQWDSGQVGMIYVDKDKIRSEFGWTRLTKLKIDKVLKILKNEVIEYDSYLRGDVYGYRIYDSNNNEVDACWGFVGDIEHCMSEAEYIVGHLINSNKSNLEKLVDTIVSKRNKKELSNV